MNFKPALILKATGIVVFVVFFLTGANARNPKVIIDADTGNEIDDVPAIALALMSNEIEVTNLSHGF